VVDHTNGPFIFLSGVRYDVEMDASINDTERRRGCLRQPGTGHDCRTLVRALMTFPDDIVERRSVEAHWVAVFPVSDDRPAAVQPDSRIDGKLRPQCAPYDKYLVNSALHPSGVAKSSTSLHWLG